MIHRILICSLVLIAGLSACRLTAASFDFSPEPSAPVAIDAEGNSFFVARHKVSGKLWIVSLDLNGRANQAFGENGMIEFSSPYEKLRHTIEIRSMVAKSGGLFILYSAHNFEVVMPDAGKPIASSTDVSVLVLALKGRAPLSDRLNYRFLFRAQQMAQVILPPLFITDSSFFVLSQAAGGNIVLRKMSFSAKTAPSIEQSFTQRALTDLADDSLRDDVSAEARRPERLYNPELVFPIQIIQKLGRDIVILVGVRGTDPVNYRRKREHQGKDPITYQVSFATLTLSPGKEPQMSRLHHWYREDGQDASRAPVPLLTSNGEVLLFEKALAQIKILEDDTLEERDQFSGDLTGRIGESIVVEAGRIRIPTATNFTSNSAGGSNFLFRWVDLELRLRRAHVPIYFRWSVFSPSTASGQCTGI